MKFDLDKKIEACTTAEQMMCFAKTQGEYIKVENGVIVEDKLLPVIERCQEGCQLECKKTDYKVKEGEGNILKIAYRS